MWIYSRRINCFLLHINTCASNSIWLCADKGPKRTACCNKETRSELPSAVTMKNVIFCYMTQCILVDVYQRFEGTYCLHLQGRRTSRISKQSSSKQACCFLSSMLFLLLHREDGGSTYLRNVSKLPDYRTSYYRDSTLQHGYLITVTKSGAASHLVILNIYWL
jgi:hypothetical protein